MRPLIVICALFLVNLDPVADGAGRTNATHGRAKKMLLQLRPETRDQVRAISERLPILLNNTHDFWRAPSYSLDSVEVLIDVSTLPSISKLLANQTFGEYDILHEDIQSVIDSISDRTDKQSKDFFSRFRSYSSIIAYMGQLTVDFASLVSRQSIGKSFEGRDLQMLRVSSNSVRAHHDDKNLTSVHEEKPEIFIDAGFHAREWLAPSTALYIAFSLASNYGKKKRITAAVDKFNFVILPLVNPDGYQYSLTRDRFWVKTRQPNINSKCFGVDLNRNFDYKWNKFGDPCENSYAGAHAFSEPESRCLRDYILRRGQKIRAYISLQAYGKLVLRPWGYTSEGSPDDRNLSSQADVIVKAIKRVSGNVFQSHQASELHPATGSSIDWTYGATKIVSSYAIELNEGSNRAGFLAEPSQIKKSGQEVTAAVIALANKLSGDSLHEWDDDEPLEGIETEDKQNTGCTVTVIRMRPQSVEEVETIKYGLPPLTNFSVDFWFPPNYFLRPVVAMVGDEMLPTIQRWASNAGLGEIEILHPDVPGSDSALRLTPRSWHSNITEFWDEYQTLAGINVFMNKLFDQNRDKGVVIKIGESYHKRDLNLTYHTHRGLENSSNNDLIFIDAGIHAREWLSPAVATYIQWYLVHANDSRVQKMMQNFDFAILPTLNPDGYQKSRGDSINGTDDREWRKSDKPNKRKSMYYGNATCAGTDLNRNFDYFWADRSFGEICAQSYHGDEPFSEPELQSLAAYLHKNRHRVKAYITLHAFGQLILFPWGYKRSKSIHYTIQEWRAKLMANKMKEIKGSNWLPCSLSDFAGVTTGSSVDWTYGALGIINSFCIELAPEDHAENGAPINRSFFFPHPQYIKPAATELLEALFSLTDDIVAEKAAKDAGKPYPPVAG